MDREEITRMAREAGFVGFDGSNKMLRKFAALVAAAEREKVAAWMIKKGLATGHGDTIEDLLQELEWQIAENQPQEFVLTQTNVGIGERGMQAYEEAKKRGWVGISDERLMGEQ